MIPCAKFLLPQEERSLRRLSFGKNAITDDAGSSKSTPVGTAAFAAIFLFVISNSGPSCRSRTNRKESVSEDRRSNLVNVGRAWSDVCPAFDVPHVRPHCVEQFLFGLQPIIQIVTVLASARQKQLVGAIRYRLRDRIVSLRGRIVSAS